MGLCEGFARLVGDDCGEVVLVGGDEVVPGEEQLGAGLGVDFAGEEEGGVGGLDGGVDVGGVVGGAGGEGLGGARVEDVEAGAGLGVDPLPVDVGLLVEEGGVFELLGRREWWLVVLGSRRWRGWKRTLKGRSWVVPVEAPLVCPLVAMASG